MRFATVLIRRAISPRLAMRIFENMCGPHSADDNGAGVQLRWLPMQPAVVSLEEARLHRRLRAYRERLDNVLTANQHAITRLFQTGRLFTREGTKAGRDLLLAHQHL